MRAEKDFLRPSKISVVGDWTLGAKIDFKRYTAA